jgi:hypothetical protein
MLLLAEIGDKMPTVAGTMVVACIIALMAFGFGLIRRWLVLLPMPLLVFYDLSLWGELQEPGFGQLIFDELGRTWVVGQFLGWNLPFVIACAVLLMIPNRRRGIFLQRRTA